LTAELDPTSRAIRRSLDHELSAETLEPDRIDVVGDGLQIGLKIGQIVGPTLPRSRSKSAGASPTGSPPTKD
jgi:hypothetical protein